MKMISKIFLLGAVFFAPGSVLAKCKWHLPSYAALYDEIALQYEYKDQFGTSGLPTLSACSGCVGHHNGYSCSCLNTRVQSGSKWKLKFGGMSGTQNNPCVESVLLTYDQQREGKVRIGVEVKEEDLQIKKCPHCGHPIGDHSVGT